MKKIANKIFTILTVLAVGFMLAACSSDDDDEVSKSTPPVSKARITRIDTNYTDISDNMNVGIPVTLTYPTSTLVGMRFVYPYKDPKGKSVMLSGMICIPKALYNSTDKKAQGIMLYNHYTIMTNEECPSYGTVEGKGPIGIKEISSLGMKVTIMSGVPSTIGIEDHKIITVAADYYGFGETSNSVQYYCEGDYNARASLEALKAAKTLLKEKGYSWGDYLINTGYSQGGQTSIAVQKLVDQGEYDEKISATFAGSGPYDLTATYKSYLDVKDQERDLAVVVYPVISYNVHKSLGMKYTELFVPKLEEKIDEWFLSKKFTREEIDQKLKDAGMGKLENAFSTELLDETSNMSQKVTNSLDTVKLTEGWTPNKNDRIYLYYSEADTLVPKVNAEEFVKFLKEKEFEIVEKETDTLGMLAKIAADGTGDPEARPAPGKVIVRKSPLDDATAHESGGAFWIMDVISELKQEFLAGAE